MSQPLKYEYAFLTEDRAGDGSTGAEAKTWSDDDVEAIRRAAFAEGEAAAQKVIAETDEARRARALETAAGAIATLDRDLESALASIQRGTAELAVAVARTIAERALSDSPLQVLRDLLSEAFLNLADEARVTITVHNSLVEAIQMEVTDLAAETGFAGRIRIVGGADELADCRIDWGDGGLERRLEAIKRDIAKRLAAYGLDMAEVAGHEES